MGEQSNQVEMLNGQLDIPDIGSPDRMKGSSTER